MASIEVKNVNSPDEVRPFADKGSANAVTVADHLVLYGTFEPGWRWSEHIKPIAGTDTCEASHLLASRTMKVAHSDGTEARSAPEPTTTRGSSDEACVAVDFGGYARYAAGR